MVPAAFGILGAAVDDEVAEGGIGTAAELAGERAARVALERLVVRSVRIVHTAVGHQRAERRVALAAVDAEKRAVLVALEESVLAFPESAWMMGAGIREKALCVRVLLSAVLAVFAHERVSSSCLMVAAASQLRLHSPCCFFRFCMSKLDGLAVVAEGLVEVFGQHPTVFVAQAEDVGVFVVVTLAFRWCVLHQQLQLVWPLMRPNVM